MVRCSSNKLVGMLNLLTLLIPIVVAWIWLANRGSSDCEKFLQKPVIYVGVFLLLVSLVGLVGAYYKNSLLLWIYLSVIVILILLLFCFTIFALVVTNQGGAQVVSNRGYEYKLKNHSHWLQKKVTKTSNWDKTRSCIQDAKICKSLGEDSDASQVISEDEKFYTKHLSPMQSGCCKPPTVCGFTFVNATYWIGMPNATADPDCTIWSNNQDELCYSCSSCKAGVLVNLKNDWRKISIFSTVIISLIIVSSVGWCHNKDDYSVRGCSCRRRKEKTKLPLTQLVGQPEYILRLERRIAQLEQQLRQPDPTLPENKAKAFIGELQADLKKIEQLEQQITQLKSTVPQNKDRIRELQNDLETLKNDLTRKLPITYAAGAGPGVHIPVAAGAGPGVHIPGAPGVHIPGAAGAETIPNGILLGIIATGILPGTIAIQSVPLRMVCF